MKVLVATRETQGSHPGDHCWTVEGELVTPVTVECCTPHLCGCGRGFPGLGSDRSTTTALVADLPHLTREQVRTAIQDSLERAGWFEALEADEADEVVEEHLVCIEAVCEAFPVGSVVSRWGTQVFLRDGRAAAA
jgi:hypothetical protein